VTPRLVRDGPQLKYFVAEGAAKEFRQLHAEELGTEDVTFLRFAADRGNSPAALEVRLLDLEVRGESFSEPPPVEVVEQSANWAPVALWLLVPVAAVAGLFASWQWFQRWARAPV
jgi:hypothetical protein